MPNSQSKCTLKLLQSEKLPCKVMVEVEEGAEGGQGHILVICDYSSNLIDGRWFSFLA
jgi:hypothetical protein